MKAKPEPQGATQSASPALAPVRMLDDLESPVTIENSHDDVTELLTPEERLWIILFRASGPHGGYCDWVSRLSWTMEAKNCPNFNCLKDAFRRYLKDRSSNSRI